MTRRFTKEEIERRGDVLYKGSIRGRLEPGDDGKFVAIDIESGDYDIGHDELAACDRLRLRHPDAQIWMVKAGSRSVHQFGGHQRKES